MSSPPQIHRSIHDRRVLQSSPTFPPRRRPLLIARKTVSGEQSAYSAARDSLSQGSPPPSPALPRRSMTRSATASTNSSNAALSPRSTRHLRAFSGSGYSSQSTSLAPNAVARGQMELRRIDRGNHCRSAETSPVPSAFSSAAANAGSRLRERRGVGDRPPHGRRPAEGLMGSATPR